MKKTPEDQGNVPLDVPHESVSKDNGIRFDCCHESEQKGVFMTVEPSTTHIEFGMFFKSEHQVSVCLCREKAEELIAFLQTSIKDLPPTSIEKRSVTL